MALKRLGIENAPIFFTPGLLLDVQALKGRVMDPGEEITPNDLEACLIRQGLDEHVFAPGDAVLIRTGHGSRFKTEAATFYDGAPGLGLPAAEWLAAKQPSVVGADNFAVDVVPPVDPEVFHPVHQHLIMKHGIYLHEGMALDALAAAAALALRLCLRATADRRRHRFAWGAIRHALSLRKHGATICFLTQRQLRLMARLGRPVLSRRERLDWVESGWAAFRSGQRVSGP